MQADIHVSNLLRTGILASALALSNGCPAVKDTETAHYVQSSGSDKIPRAELKSDGSEVEVHNEAIDLFVNKSVNDEVFEAMIHGNENDEDSAQIVHEVNEAEAKNKDSF